MKSVLITCCDLYLTDGCGMERKMVENGLEELCVNSSVLVPLFKVIKRRETCFPSNTKSIRKDLLDPKGFLIYLYLGFTQSQYVLEHMLQQNNCFNLKFFAKKRVYSYKKRLSGFSLNASSS